MAVPLNNTRVKNAKPGRHSDGKGLYLLVKPSGSKSWVLRVQFNGVRRDYGLGSIDMLGLEEARDKAREGRKLAKNGINPSLEWRQQADTITPTFETAARQYHTQVSRAWRNGKHGKQWLATLETYAFPKIGSKSVDEIDASMMQSVLLPIWLTKGETARRLRQRMGVILDFAHGSGWRETEAPMRALNQLMGGIKQPKGGNFDAMPYSDVPAFMAKLRDGDLSVGRKALQFLILTVPRSGEVRHLRQREIDWDASEWRMPPERTKTGRLHIVPLVPEALSIAKEMRDLFGEDPDAFLFPGMKGGAMSDATLSKVLRVNGGGAYTVHGFRSSFRDWAAETGQPDAWAEAALAHGNPDKVEAAYKRTTFFAQRRDKLMPAWSGFAYGPGNPVSLADRRA